MGQFYQNIYNRFKMIYALAILLFGSLCLGAPSEEFLSPISSDPLMRNMDSVLEEMGMGSQIEDYLEGLDDYLGDFEGIGSEMDDYFEGSEIGSDYADYGNRQIRTDEEPEVEIDYAEYGDYAEDDYDDYNEDLDEFEK